MNPAPDQAGTSTVAKGAWWSLALLLSINLFNYIDRYILAAVEPLVRKEFFPEGAKDAKFWMGMLAFAFLVAYMLAAPIFGMLADRWRRWAIIGGAVIVWSIASGGSGLAHVFWMLLLCRIVVGIGEAAYGPTAPTLIADMFPLSRRGAVMAWFYLAIPVGSAIGYAAGGTIAKSFGWHWAFLVTVPPGILLGLLCFARKDPPRGLSDGATAPHAGRKAKFSDYRVLLRTPAFVYNTLGMTAMTFAVGGMSFWMPTYVAEYRMKAVAGTPEGDAILEGVTWTFGVLLVITGLTATLLGGWLGDKLRGRVRGAYLMVSGISMTLAFPLFLAALYVPFPLAWWFIGGALFMAFIYTGPANTALANVTHPSIRASAYAINIFFIHAFGDAISPPLIGGLTDATGGNMNIGFLVVGVMILIGGIFWIIGARYLDRDTQLAPTRLPPD